MDAIANGILGLRPISISPFFLVTSEIKEKAVGCGESLRGFFVFSVSHKGDVKNVPGLLLFQATYDGKWPPGFWRTFPSRRHRHIPTCSSAPVAAGQKKWMNYS